MKLVNIIEQRYKKWKDERFLKKHHCHNWEQYHHRYDPDIWRSSSRVREYYHGYSFFYCIESHDHYAYKCLYDYGPGGFKYGYQEILEWCKQNCHHKFRRDFLRVSNDNWENEWWVNEISGGDYVFFAFKDSKDYINFLLRWS